MYIGFDRRWERTNLKLFVSRPIKISNIILECIYPQFRKFFNKVLITYERTWWICTIQIETRIWIVQIHISIQNITSCEKNCNIRICIKPKYVWYIFLNERTYLFPCFVSFLLHKIAFIRCAMKTFCIIRIRFDSSFYYHQYFKPWKINNHLLLSNYWVFVPNEI